MKLPKHLAVVAATIAASGAVVCVGTASRVVSRDDAVPALAQPAAEANTAYTASKFPGVYVRSVPGATGRGGAALLKKAPGVTLPKGHLPNTGRGQFKRSRPKIKHLPGGGIEAEVDDSFFVADQKPLHTTSKAPTR